MLCVLFSPQAGPAVMRGAGIAVWPVTDPENPGPFSIGSLGYGDNDRVQKFDNTTNFITRWGSSGSFDGQFSHPEAMATDSAGHVYVIDRDNHRVQQFLPSGLFLMAWGSHGSGNGQFDHPTGVAVDSTGNVYVVDQDNHRIQKFGATGTFSAQWGSNGAGDGQFNHPAGIAIDSADNVYVTDRDNHRVQKFTTTGTFITKWGNNGSSDGGFNHPIGVAVDNAANVYITDQDNHRVQKFTATGTFVIKWGSNGSGAGQFTRPAGLAVDSLGHVYVVDEDNHRIQKFSPTGTFIAQWGSSGAGDGQFNHPAGIALSRANAMYVADRDNHRVQKFAAVTTWGRTGSLEREFRGPAGIALDSRDDVYVADRYNNRIQKFTNTGALATIWGGTGTAPGQFQHPFGIGVDATDHIYVTDRDNNRVQKFTLTGVFDRAWGSRGGANGEFRRPAGLAVQGTHVYVADQDNHRMQKFTTAGTFVTAWGSAGSANGQFMRPAGVAVDSGGHVYVVDQDNNRVQKFTNTGTFVTAWGSAGNGNGQFRRPTGIAVDAAGQVYVTDCDNDRIQKFDATGTFLAQWGVTGSDAGEFRCPTDIAFDSAGNAYVTDTGPEFTIGAGLEGVANEIVVNLDALVRYPADSPGTGVPVSTRQALYPLVILAHGRHNPFEFLRDGLGERVSIAGAPAPIVDAAGNVVEFRNHAGLEYLAAHLASHGFIAVSINLNGRFHPATDFRAVRGELVEPQGNLLMCRPEVSDQAGILHRGLTILRHIQEMQRRNSTDPIFQGKIEVNSVALVGHSRGGEAVVSAYDLNRSLPAPDRASIKALLSIAPTDYRHVSIDIPYLVILGSDDEDVIDGGGLRIYDRAIPPKQMVWVIGAIHNFFSSNWHWQDEVSAAPPVTRLQHEHIARGYSNVFLQQCLPGDIQGLAAYFTGARRLNSLPAAVELHFALQTPGGLVVDHFEDTPPNKANNTLGQSVTGTALLSFDELVFHRHTPAAPRALAMADIPDILATHLTLSGCTVHLGSWFHETNAIMIAWDSTSAVYASALPHSSVLHFDVLSFRVAQDITGNPPGGQQDFQVTLIDSAGARASLRISNFTTIPFPRTKQLIFRFPAPTGPRPVEFTKSVFKTVRLPLNHFKQANAQLNLGCLGLDCLRI